jgi:hypothetical protein
MNPSALESRMLRTHPHTVSGASAKAFGFSCSFDNSVLSNHIPSCIFYGIPVKMQNHFYFPCRAGKK